jgi:hypothetical protein
MIPTLKAAQQDDPEDERQLTTHSSPLLSSGVITRCATGDFAERYSADENPSAPADDYTIAETVVTKVT